MRTVAICAIGLTAAAICGCGTLPLTGSFLSPKSARTSSMDAAAREPNPFRKTAGGPLERERRDDPQRDSRTDSSDVASSRGDDVARLQAEIADLPTDKQRAILREWKQIDASMRPHYLRVIHSQRLLRQSKSAPGRQSRTTSEDAGTPPEEDDRDGFPAVRRRTAGHVTPAAHSEAGDGRDRGPFEDVSRTDTRPPRSLDSGDRKRGPGFDDTDTPDRFRAQAGVGDPAPSRPIGGSAADRRRSVDSRLPFRNPLLSRPKGPERGNVELTAADRGSRATAEPFSSEWNRTLERLIELTDAETSKAKTPSRKDELNHLRRQVYQRMLYLLSGKTTKAVQAIPHIDAPDQEFWQKTMWGVSAYLDDRSESDRRSRATQTVTRFSEAVEHLRAEADLVVRNVVFCRKIDSFGSYDQVAKAEFRPGEQVLVYAEIENFKTELTAEGRHRTRLKSEIELFQKVGGEYRESKQKFDFPPTEDVCRSYRRDYFHSYILTLPQSLGLGDYVLKLTVTDHVGNKIGSDTVQFSVK